MGGLARAIVDLVFPPRCLACRALGSFFCDRCRARVRPVGEPFCPACRTLVDAALPICRCPAADLGFVVAAGEYDGALRAAIHAFKYRGQRAGAASLAALLAPRLAEILAPDHLLVPIPLHPSRLRRRGYNQAALLARALAAGDRSLLAERALQRTRMTVPQVELKAAERARNMTGAFTADPTICHGRTIVLVDDVCTTGSTLGAAAHVARAAGARRVYAAVLAHAQPGRDR